MNKMKEFCIEINESQPLEKVEVKLKELGYKKCLGSDYVDANNQPSFVSTYTSGRYSVHIYPLEQDPFTIALLTLEEL